MSGSYDSSQSGSDSPASPASSATFDPSDNEDQQTTWDVEPPEFKLQDDYKAIAELLTDWAYSQAFAFVKERSWQNKAAPAPTTARKRAGADPPGQGGRSVMPGRRRG